MTLQLISGSGAHHLGSISCTMKDLSSGAHVAVSITESAVRKLNTNNTDECVLEQYNTVLEQTATKKYDDNGKPKSLTLVDTDFVGG